MKIIHCADLHLGAKATSRFGEKIGSEIAQNIRNSLVRLIDYAKANDVSLILIAGDLFDRDHPYKIDNEIFYDAVGKNPDVDFVYLRGNHDKEEDRTELKNLHCFDKEWKSYTFEDVTVSAIEMSPENAQSLYSGLSLKSEDKNIVMLHGQIADAVGDDLINISKLRDKYIDYLALGHLHSYKSGKIDDRGIYAYSGCLTGRGFDEMGEKGFIVIDTDDMSHSFIPFSKFIIEEINLDITGIKGVYNVTQAALSLDLKKNKIYRINLTGEVDADDYAVAKDLEKNLSDSCAYVSVKDKTRKKIDLRSYEGDASIIGEFVRTVSQSGMNDDEKAQVLSYGLRALKGEEVEL